MNCRVIYIANKPYLDIDGTQHYAINKKKAPAKGHTYHYYVVKLPIGRDPITHKIKQHDVTGSSFEVLIDNVLSIAELSDEEIRLNRTDLSLREIKKEFFELKSISWDVASRSRMQYIWTNLQNDPIVDRTPISLSEADIIHWQMRIMQKYSIASVNQQWQLLHMLIRYAIARRHSFFDPMLYTMIFKYEPENGVALTRYQLWEILYRNYRDKHFILLAIIVLTGMRIHEALGLSWNDIDFYNKCIHIRHQCKRNPYTGNIEIIPYTKTKRSRTIYPPECFFWCLNKQKAWQEFLSATSSYSNTYHLVITKENGEPESYNPARRALIDALDATDTPAITLHDLRTTCATYGARLSGDLTAVQHYLGHKSNRTLFDYIYSNGKDQSEMIDVIDQYLSKTFRFHE